MITPASLKKIHDDEAAKTVQQKLDEEIARQDAERVLREQVDVEFAALTPVFVEAAKKHRHLDVLKLNHTDYESGPPYNELDISRVKSLRVQIYYQKLEHLGFKPTFEYGYDGGGMDSWFHLRAHW